MAVAGAFAASRLFAFAAFRSIRILFEVAPTSFMTGDKSVGAWAASAIATAASIQIPISSEALRIRSSLTDSDRFLHYTGAESYWKPTGQSILMLALGP